MIPVKKEFADATPNPVLDLQKFENECRLDTQDIQAPFDLLYSITRGVMFPTTRLSAVSLFRTCDIVRLRSKQIQDPDNLVSDPTDLVVKPYFNRFRIMLGIAQGADGLATGYFETQDAS